MLSSFLVLIKLFMLNVCVILSICSLNMHIACFVLGWRGGLVVGRRTCDLRVAGSRPGRDAAAQQP